MRALFDDEEVIDLTEPFPDLRELHGEQFTKERTNADVREIIAAPSDCGAVAGIITLLGMIKRLGHEPGERLWPALFDFCADAFKELSLQSENVQRPTPNVQYANTAL